MRWIHPSLRSFNESFFVVFILGYFLCHQSFIEFRSIPLQISRKLYKQTDHWRETCNSVSCIHTWQCSFSEGFFHVLIWAYFLFHHSPQWAPKYHFAESTTTVLANCSKKGRVELCVMKSHIRKQSLRKILSSFLVRILLSSPWAPMGSQISLCRIHDNSVSKLFEKRKGGTLCAKVTHQKAISQKASL